MTQSYAKSLLLVWFAMFCFNCSELNGNAFSTQICPWDCNIIRHVPPLQNTAQLIDCIPSELRDLPYATYPDNVEYNTVRLNFNKRFVYFPKAIIAPRTFEEAQYVLGILKKYCLPFSVRSGRHCMEPGSLSSDYIFDLSNFDDIIPDIDKQEVYIGAGCQLGTIIETLGNRDFAIPSGTCPSVGVTGLTLGGGIGLLCRQFGLTCDSVQSITLLNAQLNVVEVNQENYPDLFWALLGAGNGSYGIVLGFTFKMYYIPEATFYELTWEWDPKLIPSIFKAWQSWIKDLPDDTSSVLGIRHPDHMCSVPNESPPLVIRIFGLKIGSEPFTDWKCAFHDLNPSVKIFTGRYVDLAKFWTNESQLPFNKLKSRILMKPLTQNVIRRVKIFFKDLEENDPDFLVYFNIEAMGGAIPKNHTSFFPRDAFAWWEQAYFWNAQKENAEILALANKFYHNIPPEVSKYCYANIVDYDLGKKYLKLYYGKHVDSLIQIKKKYDPKNLFRWRQSIPTTF